MPSSIPRYLYFALAFGFLMIGSTFASEKEACTVLVPKLSGKNAKLVTRALESKGYRVKPSDLIPARFDESGPIEKSLSAQPLDRLTPGDLYLEIRGTVAGVFTTQADTRVFLKVATHSLPRELGSSRYKPWIASFSEDPKLVDADDLPKCDERILNQVAIAKLKVATDLVQQGPAPKREDPAKVNTRARKQLQDQLSGVGSLTEGSDSIRAK